VDISSLAAGRYTAAVRVGGPRGDVARFDLSLVKVPPQASGEVKINRFTRMLLVDGAPFIPLVCDVMFWGRRLAGRDVPAGALERFASESGFNTVCIWGSSPYTPENVDDCARLGLKVILFNQHELAGANREGGQEAATRRLVEITRRYRDHPALLAWCQADESNLFADEPHFIERMKLAREADPRHPFFRGDVGWAPGRGAAGGLDTVDIFCGSYA